jgi:hypothetical protein
MMPVGREARGLHSQSSPAQMVGKPGLSPEVVPSGALWQTLRYGQAAAANGER